MNLKFIQLAFGAVCLAGVMGTGSPVLAVDTAVGSDGIGTIPVYLSVDATPINVTVPTAINMAVTANTVDATVATDMTIVNKASIGVVNVEKVKATAKDAWTLVDKTEDFAGMALNSKKVYIGAKVGAETDFANIKADYVPTAGEINPQANVAIQFEGKTGGVATAVADTNIADVVITIAQK